MEEMQPGLYEALITERLKKALAASGLKHEFEKLDKADSPYLLAQYLNLLTLQTLEGVNEDEARTKQLEVANSILSTLGRFNSNLSSERVDNTKQF